jgi:hypothetical protein
MDLPIQRAAFHLIQEGFDLEQIYHQIPIDIEGALPIPKRSASAKVPV